MTGVKTGRTVHFALMNKASAWAVQALDKAVVTLPMGLKGIHSDTGSELPVDLWCRRHGAAFLRGRPAHKNDNCYAGQKNYAAVREIVGYFRCQEAAGAAGLQAVYDAYNSLLNLYYPCMKQIRCERAGAKKKRIYDRGKTPFRRLPEQPFENRLEERRVKTAALALKECTDLAEQKLQMDGAFDSLLACAHDVPVLSRRGTDRHG
jgi:hypothetical protein